MYSLRRQWWPYPRYVGPVPVIVVVCMIIASLEHNYSTDPICWDIATYDPNTQGTINFNERMFRVLWLRQRGRGY